jgi:hypothetical protein
VEARCCRLDGEDHWILCYLDAIPKRGTLLNDKHATMTPYERIT